MRKGFTLIEMLVLVAVTAILEAIFYPVASAAIGKGAPGFGYFLYLVGLAPMLLPMIMGITREVRAAQHQPRVSAVESKPFTLLHLLVVIAIIGVLASIVFPVFGNRC